MDTAGNSGPESSRAYNFDLNNPTAQVISPGAGSCQKTNFSSTFRYSDTGGSNLKTCEYKVVSSGVTTLNWTSAGTCSGAGPVDLSESITVGATANCQNQGVNTCTVSVRATDNALNSSAEGSRSFSIDWTIPYQVSWNPASRDWGNTDVSVTVQYADDGCGLDNVKYCWTTGASCTPTILFPNTWGGTTPAKSDNGSWNLCVTATDLSGNTSSPNPTCKGPYKIDKEFPVTTISPNGSDWTKNDVGFTLTCSDSYSGCNIRQYKVIDSTQTCDTSGLTTGSSGTVTCAAGSACQKKVCFRSTDLVGNIESIQTSNVFKIDKKNPIQSIWSPVSRGCGNTDVSVTVQYSDADSGMANTKYCWTTSGSCTPATSFTNGSAIPQSASGNWTLCVAATDVAGNTLTECKGIYVIDKNSPSTPTRNPVSRDWANTDVSVTVTYSDDLCGITYTRHCWTTGASCDPGTTAASTFTNGGSITQTSNGSWTLCTNARDGAGNWSGNHCSDQGAYKIDKNPPNSPTRNPASRDWDTTDIVVTVTYTDDLSGVQYTRHCWTTGAICDSGTTAANTFTNGGTVTQTSPGEWTLCTRARDVAGNWRSTDCSAQGAYKKNAKPTCTGLSGAPSSGYASLAVIFTGSGSDSDGTIVNYQWDFNGDGVWDATTTGSITGYTYASAGTYCAKLRVQDNRGAWSDTPGSCPTTCTQQIIVSADTVAPSVSVTGAPANWQNSNASAAVSCNDTASGCDAATYRLKTGTCSTNYADYTLTSPQAISSHLWVCGTAKDNVGNTGFSSLVEFKVDKLNPQVAAFDVSPKSPSWINNTIPNATISWTVSDAGDSHLLRVEVWRTVDLAGAPDPGQWQKVGSDYVAPAGLDSWSSSGSDSPANGIYWYGVHVLDNASNITTESSPIKALVDKTNPS
ncbi:MAG: PKD domain-containing protein, partial [Planctomycetaceae bacterium]